MLAKVLKKEAAAVVSPFPIPSLGSAPEGYQRLSEVVLPAVTSFEEFASFHDDVIVGSAAEDILQAARKEAARIISDAKSEGAAITERAAAAAASQDSNLLDEQVAGRVADLRRELAASIGEIAALSDTVRNGIEVETVDLAIRIAKKIVGREVSVDREIALTLVRVSLAKLHNRSAAKIHLHPDEHAYVQAHIGTLDFRGTVELVEDRSVSPGGCLITTDTGDIDARIESQFDEIAHGLLD